MDKPRSLQDVLNQQKLERIQREWEHEAVKRIPETLKKVVLESVVLTVEALEDSALLRREPTRHLIHSPDYRSVSLRGQKFSLTPRQAQIIQILHKAYTDGVPELGLHYMLNELDTLSSRLIDSFKSNKDAYRFLIIKGKKRGTYRLNI